MPRVQVGRPPPASVAGWRGAYAIQPERGVGSMAGQTRMRGDDRRHGCRGGGVELGGTRVDRRSQCQPFLPQLRQIHGTAAAPVDLRTADRALEGFDGGRHIKPDRRRATGRIHQPERLRSSVPAGGGRDPVGLAASHGDQAGLSEPGRTTRGLAGGARATTAVPMGRGQRALGTSRPRSARWAVYPWITDTTVPGRALPLSTCAPS